MLNQFSRTELLLGKEAMDKLENARVAVFGIGGVGGYVCEALVRSGVGAFDLIDDDKVCLTNLNRQIIATGIITGSTAAAFKNSGAGEVSDGRQEAVEALVALGYSSADALRAVRKVTDVPPDDVEGLLKAALKNF